MRILRKIVSIEAISGHFMITRSSSLLDSGVLGFHFWIIPLPFVSSSWFYHFFPFMSHWWSIEILLVSKLDLHNFHVNFHHWIYNSSSKSKLTSHKSILTLGKEAMMKTSLLLDFDRPVMLVCSQILDLVLKINLNFFHNLQKSVMDPL